MHTSIANLIFGALTVIFFTGVIIIICNAIKINRFSNPFKKNITEQDHIKVAFLNPKVVYLNPVFRDKFLPLISTKVFQLPPSKKMKMLN